MPYATIDDLQAGWRDLTDDEAQRAETLLARASVYLDGVVERYHIDKAAKADALRIVACDLVQRKFEAATATALSSMTQTAGAFSETLSYFRPRKSWELYPEDLELLGVRTTGRAGTIRVAIHDRDGNEIEGW